MVIQVHCLLDVPFMDQMGYTAILTMIVIAIGKLLQHKGADDEKGIPINERIV